MFVLKILQYLLYHAHICPFWSFLKCRVCFWLPQKLKNLFSETRETQKQHGYKNITAPKLFSGKFHQTLSYRAQGRAFPLVLVHGVRAGTANACSRELQKLDYFWTDTLCSDSEKTRRRLFDLASCQSSPADDRRDRQQEYYWYSTSLKTYLDKV
jgi:hypothetical protein